jgi:hypothetical protein
MIYDGCDICGAEKHPRAYACRRCMGILNRVETRRDAAGALRRFNRDARRGALHDSWHNGAFHCYYSGVALIDDPSRWRDHRYLVFEHRTPGDETSVVVTCALINRMKTDLTEEQFRTMITELARVFGGGTFDERAFPEGIAPK